MHFHCFSCKSCTWRIHSNDTENTHHALSHFFLRRLHPGHRQKPYGPRKKTSNTILCHIMIRRFMLNRTATWNDMKFQRSKIVCNAKGAQDTLDQAKHFAAVVACYKASPTRSRSRQRNESTNNTPCTYLAFMI